MPLSYATYTGNGSTTTFSVPFPYLLKSHVKLYYGLNVLAGTYTSLLADGTHYTWTSATQVQLTTAPTASQVLTIIRDTPDGQQLVDWQDGSNLIADDLNTSDLQNLYVVQEQQDRNDLGATTALAAKSAADTATANVATLTSTQVRTDGSVAMTGNLNLGGNRIVSVANPSSAQDAATKNYVDTFVNQTANIAASAVTTAKIADSAVTSAKIADGTIVAADLASDSVVTAKILDANVTTAKLADGSVTAAKIADANVTTGKLVDSSVTTAKIADANVTTGKVADSAVTTAKINDAAVTTAKINDAAVTGGKIASGTIDSSKLTGATVVTNAEVSGVTVNDTSFFTTSASDLRYFRQDSSETIASGNTWSASDNFIATTAAIDARIVDLVDDVGGFVPIANETSFPATNPDVNDGAGTLISVQSVVTTRTPASGTVTIANGSGSNTVTITGCGSTVLSSGYGLIVETTSTLHTYTFHRLVPRATEVTTVAGISGSITTVASNVADITTVANDLNEPVSEIETVAGSIANVDAVGGSIANVNTVATNIGTVNDFAARYRVAASDPTTSLDTGDLVFNTTNNELRVYNGTSWQGGVTATGNLLSKAGDTMTGALGVTAGSAGSPSLFISGDTNTGIYSPGADQVAISTNGTGRLFVDNIGRVGLGTSIYAGTAENFDPLLQIASTGAGSSASIARFSATTTHTPRFAFKKSASGTLNTNTLVSNTDVLGGITFEGSTDTGWLRGAQIEAAVDGGTTGPGSMPGRLVFSTTANGASSPTERLRITSDGKVGVGTTSPSSTLTVAGSAKVTGSTTGQIFIESNSGGYAGSINLGGTGNGLGYTAGELYFGLDNKPVIFANKASSGEAMRITGGGLVGIGTSSPAQVLDVRSGVARIRLQSSDADSNSEIQYINDARNYSVGINGATDRFRITDETAGVERLTITSAGNVGIGTTSPNANSQLHIAGSSYQPLYVNTTASDGGGAAFLRSGTQALYVGTAGSSWLTGSSTADGLIRSEANLIFATGGNTQRAQIDSSGRLLVGTSTARSNFFNGSVSAAFQIEGTGSNTRRAAIISSDTGAAGNGAYLLLARQISGGIGGNTAVTNGDSMGAVSFQGSDGTEFVEGARIEAVADAAVSANDMPTRLVFSTTADGASSPTERMRITNGGFITNKGGGAYVDDLPGAGFTLPLASTGSRATFTSRDSVIIRANRDGSDGDLITFHQDSGQEGSISVSGSTVSYNGAHLSRWSQLSSGAERTEILRGSILSNIDEMCEWGEEDNEQLNRMKVSDVEGDKNVSGVFQGWDDDDDTYTNDFYCAMTGDFIIRIGAGVTVERGDLLMSAGDGTAKPQDDDIIRSKTIAKVTSTNVSCTYDDGSYCVPCVLMAC